jgi:hypothetical protein
MRFADEMEPKLTEVRKYAMQRFTAMELRPSGLRLDANDNVDVDYSDPSNQILVAGEPWWKDEKSRQTAIDKGSAMVAVLTSDLQTLSTRLQSFYDLDSLDMTGVVGMLGGRGGSADDGPSTVDGRIAYAYSAWVSKVDNLIEEEHWGGPAARAFKTGYLDLFEAVWVNQRATVRALGITASTFHDWVDMTMRALLLVADQCIEALGGPAAPITKEARDRRIYLEGWGSLITAALGFYPPIALPMGITSIYLAGQSMFVEPKKDVAPNPVGTSVDGQSVTEVIGATLAMITAIEAHNTTEDAEFAAALDNELAGTKIVKTPNLAIIPYSMQGNPDFGTLPDVRQPGVPVEQSYVVVEISQLFQAGKVHLAGAATQYAAAASDLAWCTVRGTPTRLFPRAVSAFHAARDLLTLRLGQTGEGLTIAAEALMETARSYQMTDEQSGAVFSQMDAMQTPNTDQPRRAGGI